jgi:hypothetical protein
MTLPFFRLKLGLPSCLFRPGVDAAGNQDWHPALSVSPLITYCLPGLPALMCIGSPWDLLREGIAPYE